MLQCSVVRVINQTASCYVVTTLELMYGSPILSRKVSFPTCIPVEGQQAYLRPVLFVVQVMSDMSKLDCIHQSVAWYAC